MKHIVLWRFLADASPEQIETCFSELETLCDEFPGVAHIEVGSNQSPQGRTPEGYTHGCVMSFTDESAFAEWGRWDPQKVWAGKHLIGSDKVVESVAVLDLS